MLDYIMRTGTYAATIDTSSRNRDVCMLPSRWRVNSQEKILYQTVKKKPLVSIIISKTYDETCEHISTVVEPME